MWPMWPCLWLLSHLVSGGTASVFPLKRFEVLALVQTPYVSSKGAEFGATISSKHNPEQRKEGEKELDESSTPR